MKRGHCGCVVNLEGFLPKSTYNLSPTIPRPVKSKCISKNDYNVLLGTWFRITAAFTAENLEG